MPVPIPILEKVQYQYWYWCKMYIDTDTRRFIPISDVFWILITFFFCILEIVHYFLSNKPSDLLTQSDWSRPQLCRKIMYKYVVLLTLINATYFYYYLTQGGGPILPPPQINFFNGFWKFCLYRGLETYMKGYIPKFQDPSF